MTNTAYSYDHLGRYKQVSKTRGINGKDYVFFWAGPYSNWHMEQFEHGGKVYNCAEQAMMEQKAMLFGDNAMAAQIMKAALPSVQKALGRRVQGYDDVTWQSASIDIMTSVLVSKFTSTPRLTQLIIESGDAILVEASPYDRVWGIGMHATDPNALDETKWLGENRLGNVLMKARAIIQTNKDT